MSVAAVSWALEQWLPANEKVVLIVLADCENGQTHVCNPGQEYIAAHASCSERTVRTMLQKLEERKLITRVRRSTPEGRSTDNYILHRPGRPLPKDPQQEPAGQDDTQPANLSGSTQPANLAGSATGKSGDPNRQTVAGTEEPEVNRKNPPSPPEGGSEDSTTVEDHSLFEQFWQEYPKQVDYDHAREIWFSRHRSIEGESPSAIIAAARAFAAHHKAAGTDPQFIPSPGNWLRRGSYKNPLPAPAKSPYRKLN